MELNDNVRKLLQEPHIATLATINKDGSPQLSEVWYEYIDGEVRLTVTDTRVKTKNIQRDPRVSFVVSTVKPPYVGVEFRGKAKLSEDEGHSLIRRMAIHYLGEEEGNRDADTTLHENRLVISFVPEKVRTWDYSGRA